MSKRHQSSRRRTYGRRQHELHERPERGTVGTLGWIDESDLSTTGDGWEVRVLARTAAGDWLDSRGLD